MAKSMAPTIDKKWQAESDARTLAEAHVIREDPARFKAARKAAQKMMKEKKDEVEGLAMIAGEIDWDDENQRREEYHRRKT